MDEITHTIMPNNGGWGGTALGAGVGISRTAAAMLLPGFESD